MAYVFKIDMKENGTSYPVEIFIHAAGYLVLSSMHFDSFSTFIKVIIKTFLGKN